ncbi:hypothetical protein HDV03_000629 [Kappamyces sp. JEL0829]|nr:hypothetical protein HDV03_000629 [Kappamyces sp. JEL0829]
MCHLMTHFFPSLAQIKLVLLHNPGIIGHWLDNEPQAQLKLAQWITQGLVSPLMAGRHGSPRTLRSTVPKQLGLLEMAIERGMVGLVASLLRQNADIDHRGQWVLKKDKNRASCVWKALEKGSTSSAGLEIIQLLVDHGADFSVTDGRDFVHQSCPSYQVHCLLAKNGILHGLWDEAISRMSLELMQLFVASSGSPLSLVELVSDYDARFDRMHYMKLDRLLVFLRLLFEHGGSDVAAALFVAKQRRYPDEILALLSELDQHSNPAGSPCAL